MGTYETLDATTWAALALVLTGLGLALSWAAWRRRGLAAGLRGVAWSLLPLAAWLTGTLRLVASVVGDVSRWAVHLALSPVVWVGVGVAGVSATLFFVSGVLRRRVVPQGLETGAARLPRPTGRGDVEGMDEIEAILKKHGI